MSNELDASPLTLLSSGTQLSLWSPWDFCGDQECPVWVTTGILGVAEVTADEAVSTQKSYRCP